jgi:TnpA family transposase/DNA invertase Pin-like site-specific DNA recombinase
MIVGYARTSTVDQVAGFEAQSKELSAAGCEKIFQEQVSSVAVRLQLQSALEFVRAGDVFVVTKLDRLARSVADLMAILQTLERKRVTVRILNLGMDTQTPTGKLMLTVLGGVAQFEREMMLERQREGIAKAKSTGKYKGRKPIAPERRQHVLRLAGEGATKISIARQLGMGYFGKDQGVAAYTFRDERDLLWYSTVFSSGERESAYVIDGLMHNEVVKSDIHSTDAFGFSELVFAVSHLLGFSYAPRFKNLERQRLYIFRSRKGSDRSTWKIKPAGYADDEIVIQQWDEILRLIATIKLKEVTASDLFRRLNSYSKQHALYQALKAFGQVPKSLFILQVIDDPVLRQAIEKQLDRIEHVHRFTRAVSVGNPREFLQAEKEDQEMAEACKRLIKNCIICWNYLYLSQKLEEIEDAATRQVFLDAVAHGSVISWQHINLLGEYDFSDEKLQDNVGIRPPKLTP